MRQRIHQQSRDLLNLPAQSLRDDELLAIVLTAGLWPERELPRAAELAATYGDLGTLLRAVHLELAGPVETRGIATLIAAQELVLRAQRSVDTRAILRTPADVAAYLQPRIGTLDREQFHVLCLNTRNRLLRDACVASGTVDSCPVDPREVFRAALGSCCSAIIVAHNHPSGDATPSDADIALTYQLRDGAQLLQLRLLDSIVVTARQHASLAELGRL